MEPTGCEEHFVAVASSVKGDDTVALLAGWLTPMPSVVVEAGAGAGAEVVETGVEEVEEATTFRVTSATQEEPLSPQAFTCSVCAPVAEVTVASI